MNTIAAMSTAPIPRCSLGEYFDERLGHGRARAPLEGTLELTRRCSFDCVHCYIVSPDSNGEMTTAEVFRVLDEISDAGCLFLLLTGGEILTRPDILPIYLRAHEMGFRLELHTNGELVGPELVRALADNPPWGIEVTLYGATEVTWARVTRRRGAMQRVLRAVDLMLAAGLPLSLKTMVMDITQAELEAIRALATSRGVDFRYDPSVWPRVDGDLSPCTHRVSPEEVVRLEAADPDRVERRRRHAQSLKGYKLEGLLYDCGAGRNSFHIDSHARLSPCTAIREKTYDLRRGSFRVGWERWIPEVVQEYMAPDQACYGCDIFAYCDHCPGWAAMELGSEFLRVPFACKVAHLRAQAMPV